MHILEARQDWTLRRQRLEAPEEGFEGLSPLALWRKRRWRIASVGRDRQQVRQQNHVLRGRRCWCQERLQLREPRRRWIFPCKTGLALQLRHEWMQRAVLTVRRAEPVLAKMRRAGMWLAEPFLESGQ